MEEFWFRVIEETCVHVCEESSRSAFQKVRDDYSKASKADILRIKPMNTDSGLYCPKCGRIFPIGSDWPKYNMCPDCKRRMKWIEK